MAISSVFADTSDSIQQMDVLSILEEMQIRLEADEGKIIADYPVVEVFTEEHAAKINISNTGKTYILVIYNEEGTDIKMIKTVLAGEVNLDELVSGKYIYKMTADDGEILAGQFEVKPSVM